MAGSSDVVALDFEYPEDRQFFADHLTGGNIEQLEKEHSDLFDFRHPAIKRWEFSKTRKKALEELIEKYNGECQLCIHEECNVKEGLEPDHIIPLATNELNKKLRSMERTGSEKVPAQSFGSNHPKNLTLACRRCNAFKNAQDYSNEVKGMKSLRMLFILALMFPLMTHAVEQNDLRELVKINASDFFVVTKDKGAYVSFDIPEVDEPASLILSLFLEGGEGFGEISEFSIYPVDRVTGQVGSRGIAITVATQEDNFVDFVLPASFLNQVEHLIGFVIRTGQDSSFIFKGADDVGTVHDPRILIEEREAGQTQEFQIDSNFQSRVEEKINEIHTNTTPRWWEHTWVQLIMLLGAILGTVSLFGFRIGIADFFK